MKNIFYALLALLSFQIFGMDDKKITFQGQKITRLNYHKTQDALWYEAHLENNSFIQATLFLTGPAKNTYCCRQITMKSTNNPFQSCQNSLLPDSTFQKLKNLYIKSQGK